MLNGIFIVGTGRSGTHFIARLLSGYRNVHDPLKGKEHPKILMEIAVSAIMHKEQSIVVHRYYLDAFGALKGKVFIDQHHPNLFFVDKLSAAFPGAIFLYPRRPIVQVVASMLAHRGVQSRYRFAENHNVPFPNRFLGLESKNEISRLPLHILCAKRFAAHEREFAKLKLKYPGRVRGVEYEMLVHDPAETLNATFVPEEQAALGEFVLNESPQSASLSKYKTVLSGQQIDEVEEVGREHRP
jgi:hypothetical protein